MRSCSSHLSSWFIAAAALVSCAHDASAAVFQYCISVDIANGPSQAFLWIPPKTPEIRGVLVAGMTLAERDIVQDPLIRRACEQEQLAILFFKCGLGAVDLQKVLDELASQSGYDEIPGAPLFFIGHSAGGPQAKSLAIKMANRCFGLVLYRGGVPGGDESVPAGVPVLMMLGQFDEFGKTMRDAAGRETWEGGRDALVEWRSGDQARLGSLVVEPGAGHFAWSHRNAQYLSLYLQKAAHARIPNRKSDAHELVECRRIDSREGWLSDLTINSSGSPSAPFAQYQGDKSKATWHFDEELAKATLAYHTGISGKADQFIRWTDPAAVDAGVRYFLTDLQWSGAQTFEVHPVFANKYPSKAAKAPGPFWADAGKPVGHSQAPIKVRPVGGSPIVTAGEASFRIRYDTLAPASENGRVTFLAYSDGDGKYRYTEQVGMMPRGFKGLTRGKDQTITFPPIGDLRAGAAPIDLRATSDAGLPVEYYVAFGPAIIQDGKLKVAELPLRAKLPLPVKIVAWQFGSAREPLVRTAHSQEQTVTVVSSR